MRSGGRRVALYLRMLSRAHVLCIGARALYVRMLARAHMGACASQMGHRLGAGHEPATSNQPATTSNLGLVGAVELGEGLLQQHRPQVQRPLLPRETSEARLQQHWPQMMRSLIKSQDIYGASATDDAFPYNDRSIIPP